VTTPKTTAKKPKAPKLTPAEKNQKKLQEAFAKLEFGVLTLKGFDGFEMTADVGDLGAVKCVFLQDCKQLTELPTSLQELPILHRVLIRNCPNLTSIPKWLPERLVLLSIEKCPALRAVPLESACPKLESLSLEYTSVEELPSIKNMPNLTSLSIAGESFKRLPHDIGEHLTKLKELHVKECPALTKLPASLCDLEALETLEVYDTALETVPDRIGNLKKLKRLVLGSWGKNALETVPESIGDLESLHLLWLANNPLKSLPSRIGNLKKLGILSLYNTQLTEFPEELFNLPPFCLKHEFKWDNTKISADRVKDYKARIKALKWP